MKVKDLIRLLMDAMLNHEAGVVLPSGEIMRIDAVKVIDGDAMIFVKGWDK